MTACFAKTEKGLSSFRMDRLIFQVKCIHLLWRLLSYRFMKFSLYSNLPGLGTPDEDEGLPPSLDISLNEGLEILQSLFFKNFLIL
jgi:hypothetical protein